MSTDVGIVVWLVCVVGAIVGATIWIRKRPVNYEEFSDDETVL